MRSKAAQDCRTPKRWRGGRGLVQIWCEQIWHGMATASVEHAPGRCANSPPGRLRYGKFGAISLAARRLPCYRTLVSNQDLSEFTTGQAERETTPSIPAGAPAARVPSHIAMLRAAQYLLRVHPALGLTLGYLFLTAIGMIYEWMFFDSFDLQIFSYAEPSDFLLVAVREPLLLVFTVVSVMVMVKAVNRHSKKLERRGCYRWLHFWLAGKPWGGVVERLTSVALVVCYFLTLTSVYAEYRAKLVHKGQGSKVRVELISEAAAKPDGHAGRVYILLGTTSKYLLVYDPIDKSTQVLPANNVARLIAEK